MIANSLAPRERFVSESSLSSNQLELDATAGNFTHAATDPLSLAAMVGGGLAYRLSNLALGQLAAPLLAHSIAPLRFALQGAIKALSLGAEITLFRSIGHSQGNVFATSEFSSDFLNFGLMKFTGHFTSGFNPFMSHAFQATAMTAGHELAYRIGFGEKAQGSLASHLIQSAATILQMNAGTSLLHRLTGSRIAHLERRLDIEVGLRANVERGPEIARQAALIFRAEEAIKEIDPLDTEARRIAEESHAQSEQDRAQKIMDRNRSIVHDIRTPLNSPVMLAGMFPRLAAKLDPVELHPLLSSFREIQSLLARVKILLQECSRHHQSIEDSTETPAGKAEAHNNATRFALSEIAALSPDLINAYISANLGLPEISPKARAELQETVDKMGRFLVTLNRAVQDQRKVLSDSQLPGIVSLRDVMEEAWLLSDAERGLSNISTLTPDFPTTDILLHINHYTLSAALMNLLVNACHAMRSTSRRDLFLRARLEEEAEERHVVIEVHDSGTGISEEHRSMIFDPHFTTKPKAGSDEASSERPSGTGMGLYMVANMIRKYGGNLDLESTVGEGSLFKIRLKVFDPRIGLEEHLETTERETPLEQNNLTSLGRRYTPALLAKAEEDFLSLSRLLRTDPQSLTNSNERGIFLALLAQHLLAEQPYPLCQRGLIRLHRMLELSYVRLDFEMIRAYRDALDPDVAHYFNQLIAEANRVASPSEHLAPLDAMQVPEIAEQSSFDPLRPITVSQVDIAQSRTVYETARLIQSMSSSTSEDETHP